MEIGEKTKEFYDLLQDMHIKLVYQGEFDQEIVKSFLKMTENHLQADKADDGVRKKLFSVLVEVLQNICKHQGSGGTAYNAIFLLGSSPENYFVYTGNMIADDHIGKLREKIDKVNSLDKDGLKEFYKQSRLSSEISEVGGAGLGFIDMARKSGNKLLYSFDPVRPGVSFFTLLTTISTQ